MKNTLQSFWPKCLIGHTLGNAGIQLQIKCNSPLKTEISFDFFSLYKETVWVKNVYFWYKKGTSNCYCIKKHHESLGFEYIITELLHSEYRNKTECRCLNKLSFISSLLDLIFDINLYLALIIIGKRLVLVYHAFV